jgi:hypothetical protein
LAKFATKKIDTADGVRQFQLLFENIRLAGGVTKYDILSKLDHPETCVQSFTDERISWVFGNKK